MKTYAIDFQGYVYFEAEDEENAKEKFWKFYWETIFPHSRMDGPYLEIDTVLEVPEEE